MRKLYIYQNARCNKKLHAPIVSDLFHLSIVIEEHDRDGPLTDYKPFYLIIHHHRPAKSNPINFPLLEDKDGSEM